MTKETMIEQMVSLGLNEREAKLYYSLLQVSEAAASDLQRMSGVPRTKIYEALERMVAAGFCTERVEGRSRFFRAVRPESIHEELVKKWEQENRKRIETANTVFHELAKASRRQYDSDKSLDFIKVFRSKSQISRKYISLISESKHEILSFVRPPFASADPVNAKEQDEAEVKSLKRGVVHRSIYMVDGDGWDVVRKGQSLLSVEGEQARFINELPIKMFIFDRSSTLVALPSIPGATGADFAMVVIEDPAFAETCRILFELFWERALPQEKWVAEHGGMLVEKGD